MMRIDWSAVQADYATGMTYASIAAKHGISTQAIYKALRRFGVPLRGRATGSSHPNWGGGRVAKRGYMHVWVSEDDPMRSMVPPSNKSAHVLEHRLVFARSLGRPLNSDETVHHINGDKLDNRLENLQLHHGRHGNGVALVCNTCGSADIVPTEIGADGKV